MDDEKNKSLIKKANIGNGKVIHYNKDSTNLMEKSKVREDYISDVAKDSVAMVNNLKDKELMAKSPEEIKQYAYKQLGTQDYSLFQNNCEHFATYCRYGIAHSDQINQLKKHVDEGIEKGLNHAIHGFHIDPMKK